MKELSRLLTESGKITIAALDHRGSLQKTLHPEKPSLTTEEEMWEWKKMMVELYRGMVSGILLDPVYGKGIIQAGGGCGWMLSMEKTGYRGGQLARETELSPNWSVRQAKEMGANGVKLLLYYDPENRELAHKQKELARRVAGECEREGVVFLLEPLSYKIEDNREAEVLRIVADLRELAVDIWKFEYPGSKAACEKISGMVEKPWVLLSAGMKYERYKEALQNSCESGAAGMAVGRAVWQEFGDYQGEERTKFLREVSVARMQELAEIVERYGREAQIEDN